MPHPHRPQRTRNARRAATAAASLLLSTVAVIFGQPPGASASPAPTADTPIDGTSCAANVDGMADFTPVLGLDLPERASWLNQTPPYTFDRTADVAAGFDRVGYCLELTTPAGPQWVWTAMTPFTTDARRLGLPTRSGEITRQRVNDLEVASNVPGVTTGTDLAGYVEMWPHTYSTGGSRQISGASPSAYDADDTVNSSGGYGSFQVHQVGATRPSPAAPRTVFAVNTFTSTGAPLSLGIGSAPTGHPDWTFAGNAGTFTQRRLTVYARPSVLTLDQRPRDRQLYPRDASNTATVPVSGMISDPRVKAVQLKVTSGADEWTYTSPVTDRRDFSFSPRIDAALREYRFELRALGSGVTRRAGLWEGVLAGDVYVIQGQSNAVAAVYRGSSAGEESPFIRSYGSPTADPVLSTAERSWNYAGSEVTNQPGSIGQWGIRMTRRIVDTYGVPVAVVNGGHGGQPISFFQRNDANPDAVTTNYGRLRQRLDAAGVRADVRGLLWYQGESDSDNAAVHVTGFTALLTDWRSDIGTGIADGTRYFVYQVRTSPCSNSTTGALREAQRQMGDTHGVTLLSTNGLSGHDGCHYAWEQGYREMGDHTFAVVARDLYHGPSEGVAPPNPSAATFSNPERTEVTVHLRSDDPLTVDPGVAADFRVNGSTATVTGVEYRAGGRLVLTLSAPADGATGVSYLSHLRAGPWIVNATGSGLLTFHNLPLT
ncbi:MULTISPECIES: sialate O-acetylesterase [unclassified Micromonospora]|uniref:sialate O-acetylesterase n=1 Tax=unclassified Micromonospora TaxID=2617518 RepID=UPI002E200199